MKAPTVDQIIAAMLARSHAVFRRGKHAKNVNLVGLRAIPGTLDAFDDLTCLFWEEDDGTWTLEAYACTLDPGKPGLEHPTRSDGTAMMAAGQTRGAFKFGTHHPGTDGAYECLVPVSVIPVIRFHSVADFEAGNGTRSASNATQIHHANSQHPSTVVGAWSLGCDVIADPLEFAEFMEHCHDSEAEGNGSTFTWTILDWPVAA